MKAGNIPRAALYAVADFFRGLSDSGIFAIWMALIIISGSLAWGLTARVRGENLARAANAALGSAGDRRMLKQKISSWGIFGGAAETGTWYRTDERQLAVVWSMPVDGIFASYLTLFSINVEPELTLPLSEAAEIFAKRTPDGIPDIWLNRLTAAAGTIDAAGVGNE